MRPSSTTKHDSYSLKNYFEIQSLNEDFVSGEYFDHWMNKTVNTTSFHGDEFNLQSSERKISFNNVLSLQKF